MRIAPSPMEDAFREEVKAFLESAYTPDLRAANAKQAGLFAEPPLNGIWHKILYQKGWAAPDWPIEWGGTDWTPTQRYIFDDECAKAETPILSGVSMKLAGPIINAYGNPAQKAYFLPKILSGEDYWCQGFSEPGSGSDLASLQCRAVRDGDDYVINGTKIWTTFAQYANWIFMLVRTSTRGKPQAGITFLLAPMSSPGITLRPIFSMSGQHEVNQLFFDDVRVPVANRLGEENEGWAVTKHLLVFERGTVYAPRIRAALERVKRIAKMEPDGAGARLWDDTDFLRKVYAAEIELEAIAVTERRIISASAVGADGGQNSSFLKLKGAEATQKVTELALEAIGHYAAANQWMVGAMALNGEVVGPPHAATVTAKYLNARAVTVFGGAAEIQRNILARAVLGL